MSLRFGSRVGSLMLSAVSLLVFVGGAELIVRIVDPDLTPPTSRYQFRFDQENAAALPHHARDDALGWRLAPSQSKVLVTNTHGFRGDEFSLEKPPNTFRIACLGDSNPMGFGVKDERAPYPVRLERMLNEFVGGPKRFEVVNLGVDGYSSEQVRRLFDSFARSLDVDAYVVQVGFNDYCLAEVADQDLSFRTPVWRSALERSLAYRWLRRTLLGATRGEVELRDPVRRTSPARFRENVDWIVSNARDDGAIVFLLTTPARPTVPLVINEVRIEEEGEARYVTQDAWLRERYLAAGIDPGRDREDPRSLRILEEARREHPDWAHLAFMQARVMAAQGRAGEVREDTWQRLDREREVFAEYATEVFGAAAAAGSDEVVAIDVGAVLDAYRGKEGSKGGDLYIDFVHVNAVGHVVIATELARRFAERLASPPPSSPR